MLMPKSINREQLIHFASAMVLTVETMDSIERGEPNEYAPVISVIRQLLAKGESSAHVATVVVTLLWGVSSEPDQS